MSEQAGRLLFQKIAFDWNFQQKEGLCLHISLNIGFKRVDTIIKDVNTVAWSPCLFLWHSWADIWVLGDEVSCMTEAELATAKLLQSDNRPTNLCSHSSLFSLPSFAGLHRSLDMKPIHSLARGGLAEWLSFCSADVTSGIYRVSWSIWLSC